MNGHIFRVTLPKIANDGKGTSNADAINGILAEIATIAGGVTAADARGAWVDGNGTLVFDAVVDAYTFCDAAARDTLVARVPAWRATLVQDALVYAVQSADFDFVTA